MNDIIDNTSWYKDRDDRIRRNPGIKDFEKFKIGIVIDPQVANVYALQCLVLVTCNIVARWCRNVTIDIINCDNLLPNFNSKNFKNHLQNMMNDIDPHGKFQFSSIKEDEINSILVIGNLEKIFSKPTVYITGSGWLAGISNRPLKFSNTFVDDQNPLGPIFAASLGMSELFYHAAKQKSIAPYTKWFSLYDLKSSDNDKNLINPKFNSDFNFGNICQIGCGAVGSSFDYLFPLTKWNASFTIIDYDFVDAKNCSTSLAFTYEHALKNEKKVNVCSKLIGNTNQFFGDYTSYLQLNVNGKSDLILCFANERNVWSTIQNNIPPLTMHATSTKNWGINFGRHIPNKEWCIMCRFGDEVKGNFVPPCGEGMIEVSENSEKTILANLPFLPVGCAVLLMSEMARISIDEIRSPNFVNLSMKPPFGSVKMNLLQKPNCICTEQKFELIKKFNVDTQFWKFSEHAEKIKSKVHAGEKN